MRTLNAGLAAHLAEGATTLCHCWKLTPAQGAAMGFTDHDRDLAFDGVTFEAGAGFEASEIESSLGLAVDNLDAAGALRSDRLDAETLRLGFFDHAQIEIWRVNWSDVTQRVLMRKGHLGEVSHGGAGFTAEVRGLAEALNVTKGRLFQYGCDANAGDARCKVALSAPAFQGAGTVVRDEGGRRLSVNGLSAFAGGWFDRGTLTWTSGANAGRTEEVKSHAKSAAQAAIELWQAAGLAVAAGDTFTIRAGCDKQFSTCRAKFANADNFRGFPHMPGTDFVTRFPNARDQGNDGGRRVS
jgi:uncharacterized phage protein (TIGR02218 family)